MRSARSWSGRIVIVCTEGEWAPELPPAVPAVEIYKWYRSSLPPNSHEALVREYVTSASGPGLHPATLDRLVEPWLGKDGQPAFYRQIAQADQRFTDEIQGRYGEITLPVLVCWGEDDTWIPVAKAHELASCISSAQLRLFPGAGHLVQEDTPAELTEALLSFLQP